MSSNQSPLNRIAELKAQIAKLEADAIKELRQKREALVQEIAGIDAQLAELTGEKVAVVSKRKTKETRSMPLQELKTLLEEAPGKTVNIRKEGLDLRNIKVLADANPGLLKLGGKGAWPTVTLLK